MSATYEKDVLIVWKNNYYHIPADMWQNLPAHPVASDERVLSLVANGAAVAAIPDLPEKVEHNVGATCYLLNLDALKGSE